MATAPPPARQRFNPRGRAAALPSSYTTSGDTTIGHGDRPYPCRYVITTTTVTGWPQYIVDVRNWKTGVDASRDYAVALPAGAQKVESEDLPEFDDLGGMCQVEEGQ
jgi:hypothetical protein